MASLILLLLQCFTVSAFAGDVPVLIWSPERPLSDLPQAPPADSLGSDSFHADYLKPLAGKESHVLVVFLQDKLHVNDISKYADVYNQQSNGGAFKNIKSFMDESFSLELPQVIDSYKALKTLKKDFSGTVHDISAASDLSSLDLSGTGRFLLVVHLKPLRGAPNEEAAIANNDALVGQVCRHLQKRSIQYTALYTGKSSAQKRAVSESHSARYLLAISDGPDNNTYFAENYTDDRLNGTFYLYMTGFALCMVPHFDETKPPPEFCPTNFTIRGSSLKNGSNFNIVSIVNNTLTAQLTISNISPNISTSPVLYDLNLTMPFEFMTDRWVIKNFYLTLFNVTGQETLIENQELVTRGYDNVVVEFYSYHCSSYEWFPKNMSLPLLATITLEGFQVQPFNTTHYGFDLAQDCVPWFTTAIWMALFVIGIHLVILFFGMYMITSLTTNDRFDDPKGKTLVINAGDAS